VPEPLLDWNALDALADHSTPIHINDEAAQRVNRCRYFLENRINQLNDPIYGVNTGFGALCQVVVGPHQLQDLQHNLIRSHAAGCGALLAAEVVAWMLRLKVHALTLGYSGVRLQTVNLLAEFYNRRLWPAVPEMGSLGASGDLAPLAHLCLPLIGEGAFQIDGQIRDAVTVLEEQGLVPLELEAKEGLALLNGTQFMSAHAVTAILRVRRLMAWADAIAALSLDVFDARTEPFHPAMQAIRPHQGQVETAASIRAWRSGSQLANQFKSQVQDPYSFRCIPQVHGSARDALRFAESITMTEINSVSDNPNVFPQEELILSGGNFHGQSIALALDVLALGLVHLAGISERRIYQMQQGNRGLPPFLTQNPGLQSGLMIVQYTAAATVNAMKTLAHPHSADSITSCNGQEDYVSMGANAAVKCLKQTDLLLTVLAAEWLHASQALDLRRPARTSPVLEDLHAQFRQHVPFLDSDRQQSIDLVAARTFIDATDVRSLRPVAS
jgi:histidine ammonia-lyase